MTDQGNDYANSFQFFRERVVPPHALGKQLENIKVLVIGTCQISRLIRPAWPHLGNMTTEHILWDSTYHSEAPQIAAGQYDAVVASMSLFAILFAAVKGIGEPPGSSPYQDFNSDLLHVLGIWNKEVAEDILERATNAMSHVAANVRERVAGTPIFFNSFIEPGSDYEGNLISSTEITTFRHFIRKLNEAMMKVVTDLQNCHYVEFNDYLNFIGRGQLQDGLQIDEGSVHASFIRMGEAAEYFDTERKIDQLSHYYYSRLLDSLKILRQQDMVKIIIVDLDDTLWEGTAAEEDMPIWQRRLRRIFFVEALLYYKKRGGLLAICSKNDHAPTLVRFKAIWGDALSIEDFASVKINWEPKSQNIAEILEEVNLLPESALFIDDNPREIDEVQARFPGMRCLGKDVMMNWRRIILMSPETQVPHITRESSQRTSLIRSKVERDALAKKMSRGEWLLSLFLQEELAIVKRPGHRNYPRAFELLNKTNQFNTTGKRWAQDEVDAFFDRGGVMLAASLKDRSSDNGLIGLALVEPGKITQVVLSCRVFGLGAELVLGAEATRLAAQSGVPVHAELIDTGKNTSCHDYFDRLGFRKAGDAYVADAPCASPDWIDVHWAEQDAAIASPVAAPA